MTTSEKHAAKRCYKRLSLVGRLRARVARFLFVTLPSLRKTDLPLYCQLRIQQQHSSLTLLAPLP